MKYILLFILILVNLPANAAELFGMKLASTTQDELRKAVKMAGVKLVQEAGIDAFYDIYEGQAVLHQAKHLYLGFVKENKKFAFAEYEFNGLKQPAMLNKLLNKYGPASQVKGKFMTDVSYGWESEGIKINFYQDWKAYKTRLTYINPQALQLLRSEQKQFKLAANKAKVIYHEKAY